MKEYCVDLELAKELKEAGFPQKSVWSYFNEDSEDLAIVGTELDIAISAPCSDELLKELPIEVNGFIFRIERTNTDYVLGYFEYDEIRFGYFHNIKLSNALARMWLYLKKEGYIK